MQKTVTLFLGTAPYMSENTLTAVKVASAALEKGHTVNLIASGDGVYNFLKGQKAKGILHAGDEFSALIKKGLSVFL
jgi:sulfur relay (sulfurtransferase) complex TusBCD TusD component (DsrE family)